jgi:hypothetical protein
MKRDKNESMFAVNVGYAMLAVALITIALVAGEVIATGGKMLPVTVTTASVGQ